jgi:hypothetical protein
MKDWIRCLETMLCGGRMFINSDVLIKGSPFLSSCLREETRRAEVLDPVNKNLLLLWEHELLLPMCFPVRLGEAMKAMVESIIRNMHMMSF